MVKHGDHNRYKEVFILEHQQTHKIRINGCFKAYSSESLQELINTIDLLSIDIPEKGSLLVQSSFSQDGGPPSDGKFIIFSDQLMMESDDSSKYVLELHDEILFFNEDFDLINVAYW